MSILKESMMGRIMQFLFLGKINKFKKKIAGNKDLAKATAEFEKAAKKYEKTLQRYEKKGIEFKPGKPISLDKL